MALLKAHQPPYPETDTDIDTHTHTHTPDILVGLEGITFIGKSFMMP